MDITSLPLQKAELLQEGILFRTQFPSLRIFINEKLDKIRPPSIQLLKLKVVLAFSNSNFFTNKNSQGRKLSPI